MKKKNSKKWLHWLIAIFIVILAIGCTTDSETDSDADSAIETTTEADKEAPTIVARNQTVDYGTELSYSDLATVTDDSSEEVELSILSSDLSGVTFDDASQKVVFQSVGDFEIELSATDKEGNKSTEKVLIAVVDNIVPTITLSTTAFSLTAGDGAPNYVSIATASDNVDGDITSSIKVDSSDVNYNSAGTYEITYTVTDSSGNITTQKANVTVIAKVTNSSSNSDSSSSSSTVYVLITRTGECYHTHKCGNGNFFEVTLEEALRRGLRKCEKCY